MSFTNLRLAHHSANSNLRFRWCVCIKPFTLGTTSPLFKPSLTRAHKSEYTMAINKLVAALYPEAPRLLLITAPLIEVIVLLFRSSCSAAAMALRTTCKHLSSGVLQHWALAMCNGIMSPREAHPHLQCCWLHGQHFGTLRFGMLPAVKLLALLVFFERTSCPQ